MRESVWSRSSQRRGVPEQSRHFIYDQGRYADAEPLYKRSLAIREKALGPNHPDVATSLNNMGLLYERQGQYAEAEPLHKRALLQTNPCRFCYRALQKPNIGIFET
jgi:tetratricopeptide (TPR) repeat protein